MQGLNFCDMGKPLHSLASFFLSEKERLNQMILKGHSEANIHYSTGCIDVLIEEDVNRT